MSTSGRWRGGAGARAARRGPGRRQRSRGWPLAGLGLLLLAVVWSAVGVVQTTHECREHYARLQGLQAREWHLRDDWGRLLLEESAWASPHRVGRLARERLAMRPPEPGETKLVML